MPSPYIMNLPIVKVSIIMKYVNILAVLTNK